ncbi:amino acid transporter [Streptomyces sp. NBC_01754]|uniref:nucleotidyltransferase domain-containing protein n=1 Tax=Streptomyces sp. NBC_01754 TaxID=2975930 RepID=UPI002DD93DCE|nr:amino acid transporter [Streptomyces sp. NBC_01754]WSC91232.1 amino acid transporter [Streptomyces sp. NBC_01754]
MTRLRAPFGRWDPASLSEVVARFSGLEPWWVAGGFAIELAVGREIRSHDDIDVLLLRRDQLMVQQALPDWQWWAADPPGSLRPWASGEILPLGVHDIWCRPGPDDPWRIQIMIDESHGQEWVSRRDFQVRRPISTLGTTSAAGVPFVAPDVQLYYKAKTPRPKDEEDFDAALPVLTDQQRRRLVDAISKTYGPHPWVERLQM